MKFSELVRVLEQNGFKLIKEKGSIRYYSKSGWEIDSGGLPWFKTSAYWYLLCHFESCRAKREEGKIK